jgi:hypothetical protein
MHRRREGGATSADFDVFVDARPDVPAKTVARLFIESVDGRISPRMMETMLIAKVSTTRSYQRRGSHRELWTGAGTKHPERTSRAGRATTKQMAELVKSGALEEWRSKVLTRSLMVDGKHEAFGKFTHELLLKVVEQHEVRASVHSRAAAMYDAIANTMRSKNFKTVADIPAVTLRELMSE